MVSTKFLPAVPNSHEARAMAAAGSASVTRRSPASLVRP